MKHTIGKLSFTGMKRSGPFMCMILLICLAPLSLWAQNQNATVSGTVTDEQHNPLIGATVVVKNTHTGTTTDATGSYKINVSVGDTLVFSFLGYKTVAEEITGRTTVNVVMEATKNTLGGVVVVGYGTQNKASLTESISSISGSEMTKTVNENPINMLTGKVPGVRVWQKSANPGKYNNNFDIRGFGAPLIVIDGVPSTMDEFNRINSSDIENISVLKDASASIYGVRAANGVVLVTTKRGTKDGKVRITYTGTYTMQRPSKMPKLANPFQTMTLYNERANTFDKAKDGTYSPVYSEDQFEAYRNGTKRVVDWNGLMIAKSAPQTQHNLSISGGNERTQYYIGLGYLYQQGFLNSGDLNYKKYNFRSNLDTRIAKGLNLSVNLSYFADKRHAPYNTTVDIIRSYWRQGVLHPAYADSARTMLSYVGLDLEENPVALMTSAVSGFRTFQQKDLKPSALLKYDIGTLTPALTGLNVEALYSYNYQIDNNSTYRREYYQYGYNSQTDSYDKRLYNASSPTQLQREMIQSQETLMHFLINYDRGFGKNKVKGMFGWEGQQESRDNFNARRDLPFDSPLLFTGNKTNQEGGSDKGNVYDYTYSSLIGRVNYSYDDRYIAEFQFRYDGSSKFTPQNRWGFFPSASAGWVISKESFFKSNPALSFADQLKVRASYGESGYDGALNYDWATGYGYPATAGNAEKGYYNQYAPGYIFDGNFITAFTPLALPNQNSTWYTARTFDVGVDFDGWNGLFGFTIDYFNRYRKGLFTNVSASVPQEVGAEAPRENANSDREFGIDLVLKHRNRIGNLFYNIQAISSITRQEYLTAKQQGPYGNEYDRWRNDNLTHRYQGISFGYEGAGRFENWEDIWSNPLYTDPGTLPGDYKYEDWNGDGEINSLDEHPVGFNQTPWLNFSLNMNFTYRKFDLNILFQGSALGSMQYEEPLYSIWGSNGGGALTQYLNRWHPVNADADIYDPATQWVGGYYSYTGRPSPMSNSTFNTVSTAYFRMKSIELGYTLPKIRPLSDMNLRLFVNAYNLFTITGMEFVDPEHPADALGRLYPLNKTLTIGLSLSY